MALSGGRLKGDADRYAQRMVFSELLTSDEMRPSTYRAAGQGCFFLRRLRYFAPWTNDIPTF